VEKHRKFFGNGSRISTESFSDFFPVDSCQLPVLSGKNWSEIIGKIRESSGWNTASKIRRKSIGSGRFSAYMFGLGIFRGSVIG
jgi:hypothetical protein